MSGDVLLDRDGETVTVRVPLKTRRHGGRKLIIAPEGAAPWAPPRARIDNAMVKAIARAFRCSTSHFKTLLRGRAVIGNSNPCEFYARKFRSRIVHGNLELLVGTETSRIPLGRVLRNDLVTWVVLDQGGPGWAHRRTFWKCLPMTMSCPSS